VQPAPCPVPALAESEVIVTEELERRPARPPGHAAENRALVALANALTENPAALLQRLVEAARELCAADSAGISILEEEAGLPVFRWHAVSGAWTGCVGGSRPRDQTPCGTVLDRNCSLLMRHPERRYPALADLDPLVVEALISPFHLRGRPVGTLWIVTHGPARRFDSEDARVLGALAQFAAAGYSTLQRIGLAQGLQAERLATLNLMEDAQSARVYAERAAAALRKSEQQFRAAIDDAPIPVIIYGEDGRVLHVSRTWAELSGYDADNRTALQDWLERAPELNVASVHDRLRAALQGNSRRHQSQLEITTRAGEVRQWVFTISVPGRLADGRRFAVGMANDVTDQMRVEEKLRQNEERLQTMDRRKNYFLAMLGHELRNPIAAMRGGLELLRSAKAAAVTRANALLTVSEQAAHMERLVDELLDVVGIVEGRVALQLEPVALQRIVESAVRMLRPRIAQGGFDVRLHLPTQPLLLNGDSVRLTQIVVNVLGNAIKFSGQSRLVDVTATRADNFACLAIRDYGQGIAPALLPHIFEPFVQEKPALTLDGGLGLGLAVVRQLVELHGGHAEAFSTGEQNGTEIVLYLPLPGGAP
jgi:PAS domain S-box-containing protein